MYKLPRRKLGRAGRLGNNGFKPNITAEQFRDARVFSGFTREAAADFLGVSVRTIGHWETGAARPAYAAFKLLRVYRHGDLIDPRWSGYKLLRGKLVSPEGHTFEPTDMVWWSLTVRMAHAFRDRQRAERAARAGREAASGRPAAAALPPPPISNPDPQQGGSEATALGLVYYSTTSTFFQETPVKQLPTAACVAAKVVPQSHHASQSLALGEAQPPTPARPEGPASGLCRPDGAFPEHRRDPGPSQLPPVRHEASAPARPACGSGGSPTSGSAGRDRSIAGLFAQAGDNAHGQGGQERALPVRQRPQGQALPSGELLTRGAL